MLSVKYFCAIFLTFNILQCNLFIVNNELYTYFDFDFRDYSNNIHLLSHNTDIYTYNVYQYSSSVGPLTPINHLTYFFDMQPMSKSMCHTFSVKPFLATQFIIYTHLYKVENIEYSFMLNIYQLDDAFQYQQQAKIIDFSMKPDNILPVSYYSQIIPNNVREGAEFYSEFNKNLKKKKLAFYQIDPLYKIRILTLPKSGTHIFSGTLGGILGEHVGLFPEGDAQLISKKELEEVRVHAPFLRLLASHRILNRQRGDFLIRKFILSFRNPIEAIDSKFNAKNQMNTKCPYSKSLPGYEKEPEFMKIISRRTKVDVEGYDEVFNITQEYARYHVRYEDMMKNPKDIMCSLISFIDSIPCEVSLKKRVDQFLDENGIVSHYKQVFQNDKTSYGPRRNLLDEYPKHSIQFIYDNFKKFIVYYGYDDLYKRALGEIDNSMEQNSLSFLAENNKTLELILKYQYPYKEINNQNIQKAAPVSDWREDIDPNVDKIFRHYRNLDCQEI